MSGIRKTKEGTLTEATTSFNRPLTNIFQLLWSCLEKTLFLTHKDLPANSSTSSKGEAWWKPSRKIQLVLQHAHFIISLFDLITSIFFFLNALIFQVFLHCPYHNRDYRWSLLDDIIQISIWRKKMNSTNVEKLISVPKSLNEQFYCNLIQISQKKYVLVIQDNKKYLKIKFYLNFILLIFGSPVPLA